MDDNTASNERNIIAVAAIIVVLLFGGVWYAVWHNAEEEPADEARIVGNTGTSGLVVEDVTSGTGASAEPGMVVSVHYVGTLPDGTQFDSSRDRGEPFVFTLGNGSVIEGWERGIPGMRVGGVRELTVPPEFAYGEEGFGSAIPPDTTLHFRVELLGVESP